MPQKGIQPAVGRVAKWDNLKAVLIFLVVFCHLFRPINKAHPIMAGIFFFVYLFHMPAFIFVSGLFCKSAVKKRNYDRVFSFLLVYLFVKFLLLVVNSQLQEEAYTKLFTEGGVPWYGLAMSAFLLMTMFLERYHPAYMMVFSIVLGCLVGYCKDVGDFGVVSRILVFYPYFLAGYYLKTEDILKVTDRWYAKIVAVVALVGTCWWTLQNRETLVPFTDFLKGKENFSNLDVYPMYGGYLRLALYGVSFLLIFSLIALTPRWHIPVVTTVGKRTLAVYTLHYAVVRYFYVGFVLKDYVLANWPNHYGLAYAAISLVIVLVFSAKPFDWLVSKITTPPKRIVPEPQNPEQKN